MARSTGISGKLRFSGSDASLSSMLDATITKTGQQAIATVTNSGGAQVVTVGAIDWTGTANYLGNVPPVYPGDSSTALLFNGTTKLSGAAIISEVTQTADVGGSANLGGSISFAGNGALTEATGSAPADITLPQHINSVPSIGIGWGPIGQSVVTLAGFVRSDLRMFRNLVPSTPPGGIVTRSIGGRGASGSFTLEQDAYDYIIAAGTSLVPGTIGKLQMYVDGTNYWEIWYAIIENYEAGVDFQGQRVNYVTVPWTWTGYTVVSSTSTIGKFNKPITGSAWWP